MVLQRNYGPGDPQYDILSDADKESYRDMTDTRISDTYLNRNYQGTIQRNVSLSYGNSNVGVDVYAQPRDKTISELRLQGSSPTNPLVGQTQYDSINNRIPTIDAYKQNYVNNNMSYLAPSSSSMYMAPSQSVINSYVDNSKLYNAKLSSFNDTLTEAKLNSLGITADKWFGSTLVQDEVYQRLSDNPMTRPTPTNSGYIKASDFGDYTALRYNPSSQSLQPTTSFYNAPTDYSASNYQTSNFLTSVNPIDLNSPNALKYSAPGMYKDISSGANIRIAKPFVSAGRGPAIGETASTSLTDPTLAIDTNRGIYASPVGSSVFVNQSPYLQTDPTFSRDNITYFNTPVNISQNASINKAASGGGISPTQMRNIGAPVGNMSATGNMSPTVNMSPMGNVTPSPVPYFYDAIKSGTLGLSTETSPTTRFKAPFVNAQPVDATPTYNNLINGNVSPISFNSLMSPTTTPISYNTIIDKTALTNRQSSYSAPSVKKSPSILDNFIGGVTSYFNSSAQMYSNQTDPTLSTSLYPVDAAKQSVNDNLKLYTAPKTNQVTVYNLDPTRPSSSLESALNKNTLLPNTQYKVLDAQKGSTYYDKMRDGTIVPTGNFMLNTGVTNPENYAVTAKGWGGYAIQSKQGGQSAVIATSDLLFNDTALASRYDHEQLHMMGLPADNMSTNAGYQSQLKATGKTANEADYYKYLLNMGSTPAVSKTYSPVTVQNKILANDTFTANNPATVKIQPAPNVFDWLTSWSRPQNEQQNTGFNNYQFANGQYLLKTSRKQKQNKPQKMYKVTKPTKQVVKINHQKSTIKQPKLTTPPKVVYRPLKPIASKAKINTKVMGGMLRGFGQQTPMVPRNVAKPPKVPKSMVKSPKMPRVKQSKKNVLNYFY